MAKTAEHVSVNPRYKDLSQCTRADVARIAGIIGAKTWEDTSPGNFQPDISRIILYSDVSDYVSATFRMFKDQVRPEEVRLESNFTKVHMCETSGNPVVVYFGKERVDFFCRGYAGQSIRVMGLSQTEAYMREIKTMAAPARYRRALAFCENSQQK